MAQVNITTRDTHRTTTRHKAKQHSRRRYSFSLVVFGIACLVFLVMDALQLKQTAHFGSLFPLAQKLETGAPVSADVLSRYVKLAGEVTAGEYCRSDIVMAGATVILADLDRQNQSLDYDAWADAISRGEGYFEHAISCTPTNGNYWLRLALIRRAVAERPAELATLMRESVLMAPADQDIIIGRFSLWNNASAATLEAARSSVESDIRTILDNGNAFQIVPAIKDIGKNLAPYFRKIAQSVPGDKLALYKKAGLDVANLP